MVRFHMSLLLAGTIASGLLFSKLLLVAGLHSVLYRYPVSVLSAYLVFAGLARLWVAYVLINAVADKGRTTSIGFDLGGDILSNAGSSSGSSMSFGGGDSGGAGASDVWESSTPQLTAVQTSGGGGGLQFPGLDLDLDLDEGFWILLVFGLLILVLACAGGYLIWAAPQILPDLALNALLASTLTGAAKRAESQGWIVSVLRATFVPLLLILGVTIGLAVVVHRHCPGAEKLTTALACPDEMRPPN